MPYRQKKVFCPKYDRDRGGKYIDSRECYACLFLGSVQTDSVECLFGPSKPFSLRASTE